MELNLMLQSPNRRSETESATQELDKLLLDAIKGLVYESHEEHVDYESESRAANRQESSGDGGGGSVLPMLIVGIVFAAIGYTIGKRSGSGGEFAGEAGERIRVGSDEAASRTEEFAETAADRVRETGQELSERTETTAEEAADRIDEGSEEVADRVEEGGSEAADEMEETEEE